MKFGIWLFLKICWGNSGFGKIWQKQQVLYMKTNIRLWSHVVHFFLEWGMFQTEVVKKIKTHFIFSNFVENLVFYEIMWKNIVEPGRPQMTVWCMHNCMLDTWGYKHTLIICWHVHCLSCLRWGCHTHFYNVGVLYKVVLFVLLPLHCHFMYGLRLIPRIDARNYSPRVGPLVTVR
jgi:hypothetical protein